MSASTQAQLSETQLRQLADIELPAAMPTTDLSLWLLAFGAIVVLAVCIYFFYLRKRRTSSEPNARSAASLPISPLTQLAHIEQQWRDGRLDDRETAYHLATLLRLAFALPQLDSTCPPALRNETSQWSDTLAMLNQLRYTQSKYALDTATFQLIARWLKGAQGKR